jgi:hypothetical protein
MPEDFAVQAEDIGGISLQVSAFDQHGSIETGTQLTGALLHVVGGVHCAFPQHTGLVQIGGNEGRERKQFVDQSANGGVFEQSAAAGGDHDRVNDEGDAPVAKLLPGLGHRMHLCTSSKHASFRRGNRETAKQHTHLICNELRIQQSHLGNDSGCLRDDTGQRIQAVAAEG